MTMDNSGGAKSGEDKNRGIIARLLDGDPAALARAISIIERNNPASKDILTAIQPHVGKALVVGFTGPPGVGKSTLVNAYIGELRRRQKKVGVVAVDPSSPLSGGAVLGDRIRMSEHISDSGVFIRSLASRGHLGGLSPMTAHVADLMGASGFDIVILETVGTGQSEVEMTEIADVKIVISAPGFGDDVQAIKAGILEIGEILVVNKADLPLAEHTIGQLKAMLALRTPTDWTVPVLATTALDGKGVIDLADAIDRKAAHNAQAFNQRAPIQRDPEWRLRQILADAAGKRIETYVRHTESARLKALLHALQDGSIDIDAAVDDVIDALHEDVLNDANA